MRDDINGSTLASKAGNRQRITQACEPCRRRKAKCSRHRPVCESCHKLREFCYYRGRIPSSEAERLIQKIQVYENLLQRLSTRVSREDAEHIKYILETQTEHGVNPETEDARGVSNNKDARDGGHSSLSSTGSLDVLDRVEEDFNRSERMRAMGFMGKHSEIMWMLRLKRAVNQGAHLAKGLSLPQSPTSNWISSGQIRSSPGDSALTSMSYYLDDLNISVSSPVDPYQLPSRHTADRLFSVYLESMHPSFPIIGKSAFISQYKLLFDRPGAKPGNTWLAILNMIFAIADRHSHHFLAEWRGNPEEHLVYLTRARTLSMDGDALFRHPDLQQVQVEGLISFYLLATGQINRSWKIAGIAVRSALALGINLQNVSPAITDISKEIRCRVWWSLYTLEHILASMTGRSTCITGACTVPLPIPYGEERFGEDEVIQLLKVSEFRNSHFQSTVSRLSSITCSSSSLGQSTSGPNDRSTRRAQSTCRVELLTSISPNHASYFYYYVDLILLTREVIGSLYTPEVVQNSTIDVEHTISTLSWKVDTWLANLPEVYDFTTGQTNQHFSKQRLSLALHYYGTKIAITRPCICQLDRQASSNTGSGDFIQKTAIQSIRSACSILDLIPDDPDAIWLNINTPWWCVLHFLMQATTVLFLELSFRVVHLPHEANNILAKTKKAIRWLYHLSGESNAAHRAWILCDDIIRQLAPTIGLDISDLPLRLPAEEFIDFDIFGSFPIYPDLPVSPWENALTSSLSLNPQVEMLTASGSQDIQV